MIKKTYIALGDNNFWYATGPKKFVEAQAKLAIKGKGDFEDGNMPELEEMYIFEAVEIDKLRVPEHLFCTAQVKEDLCGNEVYKDEYCRKHYKMFVKDEE